jgi:hypothetical protein
MEGAEMKNGNIDKTNTAGLNKVQAPRRFDSGLLTQDKNFLRCQSRSAVRDSEVLPSISCQQTRGIDFQFMPKALFQCQKNCRDNNTGVSTRTF